VSLTKIIDWSDNGNLSFYVSSDPTIEPISVEELKNFARIDSPSESGILSDFIVMVRKAAEEYTNKAFLSQTITCVLDWWPKCNELIVPVRPLLSATEIRVYDGGWSIFDTDYYRADQAADRVRLESGVSPPLPGSDRPRSGIEVDYEAGFGSTADSVPSPIRLALLIWARDVYENRGIPNTYRSMGISYIEEIPGQARKILNMYRKIKI